MKTEFDYRIVEEDGCYSIREASYDENGEIESYGKDESHPIGVTPNDLAEDLNETYIIIKLLAAGDRHLWLCCHLAKRLLIMIMDNAHEKHWSRNYAYF